MIRKRLHACSVKTYNQEARRSVFWHFKLYTDTRSPFLYLNDTINIYSRFHMIRMPLKRTMPPAFCSFFWSKLITNYSFHVQNTPIIQRERYEVNSLKGERIINSFQWFFQDTTIQLEKVQLFQVGVHSHLSHPQLKTRSDSFNTLA